MHPKKDSCTAFSTVHCKKNKCSKHTTVFNTQSCCGPALLTEDSTHGQVACSNWLTDSLTHSLTHSACSSCVVWTWQPLLLHKFLYSRFSILNTRSASTLVMHAFFVWVWLRWTKPGTRLKSLSSADKVILILEINKSFTWCIQQKQTTSTTKTWHTILVIRRNKILLSSESSWLDGYSKNLKYFLIECYSLAFLILLRPPLFPACMQAG